MDRHRLLYTTYPREEFHFLGRKSYETNQPLHKHKEVTMETMSQILYWMMMAVVILVRSPAILGVVLGIG
jgi:hypothetical protein